MNFAKLIFIKIIFSPNFHDLPLFLTIFPALGRIVTKIKYENMRYFNQGNVNSLLAHIPPSRMIFEREAPGRGLRQKGGFG